MTRGYTHYRLDDGRLWDIDAGQFVPELPEGAVPVRCIGEDGKSSDEEATNPIGKGAFLRLWGPAYGFTGQSIWRGKPACSGTSRRACL